MKRNLAGMVVIVTGASAGIGKAVCEQLSAAGANLVLAARRMDKLEALNASLGGRHFCQPTDVSRQDKCQRLIEASVAKFGRIDTLICNAGYGLIRRVADTTVEEMDAIFRTNVFGTTDCIRAATPVMASQSLRDGVRGQVMIVSSAAGRRGLPYFGAYSATKAAQLSLAEALRVELHPAKIAVTSIHPIGTDSDFFEVAKSVSGKKLHESPVEIHQSSETVARAMVRAIEQPKAEVWPMRPSRWGLSLATFFPTFVDRAMRKHERALTSANSSPR